MAGWLQKILSSSPAQTQKSGQLPASQGSRGPQMPAGLPNATIIYGIGASALFVAAFFLLVNGRWLPGITVFALGVCFMGFALHLLKHQD